MNEILTLSSGDLPFFFEDQLGNFGPVPYLWDSLRGNGFGENFSALLWIRTYLTLSVFIFHSLFHFNWLVVQIIFFWVAFLLIALTSTYIFVKTLFNKSNLYFFVFFLVYFFNTYILMILEGGQVGIVLAYAIAPLVFALFYREITRGGFFLKGVIFASFALSLQTLFDLRIVYVTLLLVFAWWIYIFFTSTLKEKITKKGLLSYASILIFPLCLSFLIHAFWILPTLLFGGAQSAISLYIPTKDVLSFFSFAKFEDTFSLLHPNWPENIFGKAYFMRPQFLIIPVLAFFSLLFVKDKMEKRLSIFFGLIALLGVFLAKGTNEPFGQVYSWLFSYFPGFSLFRDSTKWYLLTSFAYSVLIIITVTNISKLYFINKTKLFGKIAIMSVFISMWVLLILPIIYYKKGTFVAHFVPEEYVALKDFLLKENNFSRTLWIPTYQRFGYSSYNHPAVSAVDYYKTTDLNKIVKKLKTQEHAKELAQAGIKYIIVPFDSEGEIFLNDRKYDDSLYQHTVNEISKVSSFKNAQSFGKIQVIKVTDPFPRFYVLNNAGKIKPVEYIMDNPTQYSLSLIEVSSGDKLIFNEQYDKDWRGVIDSENSVTSTKFLNFNSFEISKPGVNTFKIFFLPQLFVNVGLVISGVTILCCVVVLFKKKKMT